MTIKGTIRGKTIELPTTLPYPDGHEVTIEVISANGAPTGSPSSLLAAIQRCPKVDLATIEEWERVIQEGRIPVKPHGTFDADATL